MILKKHFVLYLLATISIQGYSQQMLNEQTYAIEYKRAVQLYANQKFIEAQTVLMPLTLHKYNNIYSPYVHYYYALIATKLNRYFEARIMLRQLMERYPDWNKIDEANYLYANANFADNYFDEGISNLEKIILTSLKKEAIGMEYHYLKPIKDILLLKKLNRQHPDDATIARLLIENIQASKHPSREELELSDRLSNQIGPIKNNTNQQPPKPNTPQKSELAKDFVNMAVLLPFRLNEQYKNDRSNQYIFELYEGIKIAKEKLATDKITLNVFAFDIDKNIDDMLDVVNNNSLANMDILLGPLYPEVNKIASAYAQENKILQIHPLSNNSQLINNQSYTFLALPSYELQAIKALEFINIENPIKSVAIYFGKSRKDSVFAYIYRDNAVRKGYEITTIRKFGSDADIDIKRKVGHVFFAGSDDNIGSKLVLALDKKKINAPVMATATAFELDKTSLTIVNRPLFLIQLDYIDKEKNEVKNFKTTYINYQNIAPNYYAYWGYDFTLFFSKMLQSGKKNFRNKLNDIDYTQGFTLSGFDYTGGGNINQIVPIVKYNEGKFVEVSR